MRNLHKSTKRLILWGVILFFVGIILTACSVDNSSGGAYDELGIRYSPDNQLALMPSKRIYATFSQMNSFYVEMEECMGMYAPGPTIWYIDFQEWQNGLRSTDDAGVGGWGLSGAGTGYEWLRAAGMLTEDPTIYDTPGFVFVNNNEHIVPGITFDYRDYDTDRETLRHEFIHHIIREHGGTDPGTGSHGTLGGINYFQKCDAVGVNVSL